MTTETYVCPVCDMESWNPNDARERYCGNCHGYTGLEAPPGMVWARFEDGDHTFGRLVRTPTEGDRYTVIGTDRDYMFDGEKYVRA